MTVAIGCSALKVAPEVGLEPTTLRLTAECSAIELLRNVACEARMMPQGHLVYIKVGEWGQSLTGRLAGCSTATESLNVLKLRDNESGRRDKQAGIGSYSSMRAHWTSFLASISFCFFPFSARLCATKCCGAVPACGGKRGACVAGDCSACLERSTGDCGGGPRSIDGGAGEDFAPV